MEQSYHVVVGNDKRIKIWDREHKLLCDLNIKVSFLLFSTVYHIDGRSSQHLEPSSLKKFTTALKCSKQLPKNMKMIYPSVSLKIWK